MDALVLTVFGFYSGALPLAVMLGDFVLTRDFRDVGDPYRDAFDVLRAGALFWGAVAISLELVKGAFPVALAAHVLHVDGLGLVACAIAPVLGHAWSPFLDFRGGRPIAVSIGVWLGLTFWTVPLAGVSLLLIGTLLFTVSGWALMLSMGGIAAFLLINGARWELWLILALNLAVFVIKHQADLAMPIRFRWQK